MLDRTWPGERSAFRAGLLWILLTATGSDSSGFPGQDEAQLPLALVRGRIVLEDGTPAIGAEVELAGDAHGRHSTEAWPTVSGTCDSRGRFELLCAPPIGFDLDLHVRCADRPATAWTIGPVKAGDDRDLGDLIVERGATVTGRVVDRDGNAMTSGWTVSGTWWRDGRPSTWLAYEAVDDHGEFRFGNLTPGRLTLRASHPLTVEVELAVLLKAGEQRVVEIPYSYASPERRVLLRVVGMVSVPPDPATIRLVGVNWEAHPERGPQCFLFDDVPPGEYFVEIRDPHYRPWGKMGVHPGDEVHALLRGRSAIRLQVVDQQTGRPFERYAVSMELVHPGLAEPVVERLIGSRTPPPRDGLFGQVVPGTFHLRVEPPGRPMARVQVVDLAPGEERELRIEIPRAVPLAGRVLDADGRPVHWAPVELTPEPRSGGVWPGRVVTTDLAGRFTIDDAAAGRHVLRVWWRRWLSEARSVELPSASADELVLRMPPAGWIVGRVILPESVALDRLALQFDVPSQTDTPWVDASEAGGIDPAGRFRLGPFPPGSIGVWFTVRTDTAELDENGWTRLDSVSVEAGREQQVSWDLRTDFRVAARFRVTIDGCSAPWAQVLAIPAEERLAGRAPRRGTFDGDGELVLGLAPGVWDVHFRPRDGRWSKSIGPVRVAHGDTATIEVDVRTVKKLVSVFDSAGEPLTHGAVRIYTGRTTYPGLTYLRTDAEGSAVLGLPEGSIEVLPGENTGAAEPIVLDWRGGAPDQLFLHLAN